MADLTFNTNAGTVVERKLLILYMNTSTDSSPEWTAPWNTIGAKKPKRIFSA